MPHLSRARAANATDVASLLRLIRMSLVARFRERVTSNPNAVIRIGRTTGNPCHLPHRIYGRHENNSSLSRPHLSRSSKDLIVMPTHAKHNVVWGQLTRQPQVTRRPYFPDI